MANEPLFDSVRRAELEARAALERGDPAAWDLVRAAAARRRFHAIKDTADGQ
jgi:hypothetical protein